MSNINLLQSVEEKKENVRYGNGNKSVVISLVILVAVLLIFGILKLYTNSLNGKIITISGQIETESRDLTGKDVDRIADIQERIKKIRLNISEKKDQRNILTEIEKSVVNGTVVTKLEEKGSILILTIQTKNFTDASRQIISFKKSSFFTGAKLTGISRDKDGNVVSVIEMSVN